MSDLHLPGPPIDENEPDASANSRRPKGRIPDREECVRAIQQLAGLVALGILTPAQANSIRASYREILNHHDRAHVAAGGAGLADRNVLELARNHPDILSMLESILTDEQIELVMQDRGGDDHD